MPAEACELAGYRCMKLGTVEEPLAVRLVGSTGVMQKTRRPGDGPRQRGRLQRPRRTRATAFEFKDGLFRSTRPFTNVACVVVALAGGEAQQYPVPILGGEPVSLQFETSLQAAEAAAVHPRRHQPHSSASADARHAQSICSDATAKLIDKQKNADALARAKGGHQAADAADKSIAEDLTRLKEQVGLAPEGPRIVAAIEQNLKAAARLQPEAGRSHQETGGRGPPRERPHRRRPPGPDRIDRGKDQDPSRRRRRGGGHQRLRSAHHARARQPRREGPARQAHGRLEAEERRARQGPRLPPQDLAGDRHHPRLSWKACRASAQPWRSA